MTLSRCGYRVSQSEGMGWLMPAEIKKVRAAVVPRPGTTQFVTGFEMLRQQITRVNADIEVQRHIYLLWYLFYERCLLRFYKG